jgi:hypothetical protein
MPSSFCDTHQVQACRSASPSRYSLPDCPHRVLGKKEGHPRGRLRRASQPRGALPTLPSARTSRRAPNNHRPERRLPRDTRSIRRWQNFRACVASLGLGGGCGAGSSNAAAAAPDSPDVALASCPDFLSQPVPTTVAPRIAATTIRENRSLFSATACLRT